MEMCLIVVVVLGIVFGTVCMMSDDGCVEFEKKDKNTSHTITNKVSRKYTRAEIEEAWKSINDYINGVPPNIGDTILNVGFGVFGFWFGKVCFFPLLGCYMLLNCFGPLSGPLDMLSLIGKGDTGMALLMGVVQLFIFVFAMIGVVLSLVEFFGYDKKSIIEKNLKELAEKVQIALKENEELYEEEINDLNSQIGDLQNDKELLEEQLKDNESSIKNKLKQMKDMYDREKRLLMLENKELRVKLKYSNTLKDELNEDSPLNGLYE